MTGVKISALTAASALSGSETIPLVQSGSTVGASSAQILAYVTPLVLTAVPNGSAAAPSLAFANSTTTGAYRPLDGTYGAGFGVGVQGKQAMEVYYRSAALFDFDNIRVRLGTTTAVTNTTTDTYVVTIDTPSLNITGSAARYIGFNIGSIQLTGTDTATMTSQQCVLEMDKIDVYQTTSQAKTWNNFVNTRFRFAIPHTNQTIVDNLGISFVVPTVSDSGAAVTNYKAVHIPSLTGGGGTNFAGVWFENNPNAGSIASGDGIAISIVSSSLGTAAGSVVINGDNTGGTVELQGNSRRALITGTIGASLNYLSVYANNTPTVQANHGSTANVALALSSKGTEEVGFYTSAQGAKQARVIHTATPANTVDMTGGASGANPRIGASAENLVLGTGSALATNATAGFIMVPGMAGIASGAPTGAGAGAFPLVYDSTNNKIGIYDGGWIWTAALS
jgi:hypothetical protein